jgi:tetratricopeptide (TPR) repeat protein
VGGTENAEAYDLFLRALFWRNRGTPADGLRAAELLREATAEDPAYALAWAEMAWALELGAIDSPNRDTLMAEAREAVDRALALAPRLWEAHRERAVLHFVDGDWEAAERARADARKLAPASEWPCLDALFIRVLGGDVETFVACARARRARDPLSLTASTQLLIGLYEAGRNEEAYAEYERGRDLVGGRAFAELFGQLLAWRIGDAELVQTHFDRLATLYEPTPEHLARMVEVHADKDAALEAIHIAMQDPRMQQPWLQGTHALWLAHYGDDQGAAEALGRAVRLPDSDALEVLWASDLAGARRLPEFKEIVRELGYVDYWRESGKWPSLCRPLGQGGDFECF